MTPVQGYLGDTAAISVDVHRMLETMDGIDFFAFAPRGGASTARARVDAFRNTFSEVATLLNRHVVEHYAIVDRPANRAKLASSATKDIRKFTQDLGAVSDASGDSWAYPLRVGALPAIPGPRFPHF